MVLGSPLLIERQGGVVSFILNDAPWNRMSFAYMDLLEAALEEVAVDSAVRALVFTPPERPTSRSEWTSSR